MSTTTGAVTESSESDVGSLSDWTLVQPLTTTSFEESGEHQNYSSLETLELNQPDQGSKIQEVTESELNSWQKNSDGSDVERISEDGADESYPTDSSAMSQVSHFSFIQAKDCAEKDAESFGGSSSSGVSVVAEDDNTDLSTFGYSKDGEQLLTDINIRRVRSYTHTPNRRLNIALSVVLILSVTLVLGLGIGHFLGWSSRWSQQYRLHQTHIVKLQALQEELVSCLQSQTDDNDQQLVACYEKVDYWKQRFEDILAENRVLQDFVTRNKVTEEAIEEDEKCEEVNKNMVAEYRKLKFHLISQQLENMDTLKKMEDMKKQEMAMLDGLKQLEKENEELKAHLEMNETKVDTESEADKADELMIRQLSDENLELKRELAQLTIALQMEEEEDTKTIEEIGTLRQRINNLLVENSDLQKVIARLRYAQPVKAQEQPQEEEDSWLESTGWPDLHMAGFIDHLLKIATDKEAAKQELSQLQENLRNSYEELSKKAKEGLHTGKDILGQVHKDFESKFAAFVNSNFGSATLSTETILQIGKSLGNAMLKLYKIGADGMTSGGEEDRGKGESGVAKKIEKVLKGMEKQWESIRDKMWGTLTSSKKKPPPSSGNQQIEQNLAEKNSEKKLKNAVPEESKIPEEHLSEFKETNQHDASQSKNEYRQKKSNKSGKNKEHKDKKIHKLNPSDGVKADRKSRKVEMKRSGKDKVSKKSKKVKNDYYLEEEDELKMGNCTAPVDNWFQARAEFRDSARRIEDAESDNWLFDRASNRQKSRSTEVTDQPNWYFQRAKHRRGSSYSSKKKNKKNHKKVESEASDDEDEKMKAEKKKKRQSKDKLRKESKSKRRDWEDESESDDDRQTYKRTEWHKYQHRQEHFEWRAPDSHFSF